jgi:mRNA-decapping enzyme 1B
VLKRRDAAIIKILDMAGHVVLYQFNEDSKAWDRKGVEGSLFVVERSTEPRYQFVVLNRLSSENLIETVDADFQTELTDSFLLYRNLKQEILGVWFYSPPERTAISDLLGTLTGDLEEAAEPPPAEPEPAYAAPPPVVVPTAPMAAAAPLVAGLTRGAAAGGGPGPAGRDSLGELTEALVDRSQAWPPGVLLRDAGAEPRIGG